jgi:hypothetical protein
MAAAAPALRAVGMGDRIRHWIPDRILYCADVRCVRISLSADDVDLPLCETGIGWLTYR